MYQAVIEGKIVNLRNRDYERILDRLDVSKLDEWGERWKQCPLCARIEGCDSCTFDQFSSNNIAGCWRLVNRFFRHKGLKLLFDLNEWRVVAYTTKQCEQLQMLHDAFERSFRRI